MPQEVAAAFDEMTPAAVASYTRGGMDADSVARLKAALGSARAFAAKFWMGLLGVTWILSGASPSTREPGWPGRRPRPRRRATTG